MQSKTTIPIPKVLDWSDDPSNPIRSEYIIMEHAPGVQLHKVWPTMTGPQQILCIKSICLNIKQMIELQCQGYGSLYFAETPLLDDSTRLESTPQFCIGPHSGRRYWDCTVGEKRFDTFAQPNRGPCECNLRRSKCGGILTNSQRA